MWWWGEEELNAEAQSSQRRETQEGHDLSCPNVFSD